MGSDMAYREGSQEDIPGGKLTPQTGPEGPPQQRTSSSTSKHGITCFLIPLTHAYTTLGLMPTIIILCTYVKRELFVFWMFMILKHGENRWPHPSGFVWPGKM